MDDMEDLNEAARMLLWYEVRYREVTAEIFKYFGKEYDGEALWDMAKTQYMKNMSEGKIVYLCPPLSIETTVSDIVERDGYELYHLCIGDKPSYYAIFNKELMIPYPIEE